MVNNKIYASFLGISLIFLSIGVFSESAGFFWKVFNGNAGFLFGSLAVLVIVMGFFKGE